MGSLKMLAVAGAVIFGVSATAHAADLPPPPMLEPSAPELRGSIGSGWYLRGDVGIGLTKEKPDLEFTSNGAQILLPPGASFTVNDFRLGHTTLFGAGIGYQFNNWLRADVTAELRTNASIHGRDTFLFPTGGTTGQRQTNNYSGSLSSQVYLANVYADLGTFCTFGCLTPYIGAGVGMANHKMSQITDTSVQGPYNTAIAPSSVYTGQTFAFNTFFAEKSRTNLAWALMAGVGMDVTKNLKLELGYRYLNMGKAETGYAELSGLAGNAGGLQMKVKDIDSHDFRLGMRWMLNADCCAAPVASYAPPPPMVRKF